MISRDKLVNRLNSINIPFVESAVTGLIAINPSDVDRFRVVMHDQDHYIRWLDRDYRISKAFANFGTPGFVIHKGVLTKPYVLSCRRYAEGVDLPRVDDTVNFHHGVEGMTTNNVSSAVYEYYHGALDSKIPVAVGLGKDRFTSSKSLQLGGFAIQPRLALSVSHPFHLIPYYMLSGVGKTTLAYQSDFGLDAPDIGIDGVDKNGVSRYASIADMQNWILVTGPTALTVGEFHESGFAWIWANNDEVASVMRWEMERRQGAEKIDLRNKIRDMVATGGGIGVIRGTPTINRFVLHPITRREMVSLSETVGVKDGMDFDRSKIDWNSNRWLPIGGKDQTSLSMLAALYTNTYWVVTRIAEETYVFTTTQKEVSTQTIVGLASCKAFAHDLGWGGATVYEGSDTFVVGASSTPALVVIAKTPGPFNDGLKGVYPTAMTGDDGFIGKVAISQLMAASTDKNHPANALCNPHFTASL